MARAASHFRRVVGLVSVAAVAGFVAAGCGGGGGREESGAFGPVWSPDGRLIAFVLDPDPSAGCPYGACAFRNQIWVMRADGSGARMLGRGSGASWSPDGRTLAVERPLDDIYTIGVGGTGRQRLTSTGDARDPVWSPDGRQLAFVHWTLADDPDKASEIYLVNADGSGQRRLTGLAADQVAWSSGGAIALTVFDTLYTVNPDGTQLQRLFTSELLMGEGLEWSPDGRRIAFGWGAGFGVVRADGTMLLPGLPQIPDKGEPCWSPDGHRLAFAAAGHRIYIVAGDGSHLRPLRQRTDGGPLSWSPNGRRIAFADDGDLYAIDSDGTRRRQLTDKTRFTDHYTAMRIDAPREITAGSDGALWFANEGGDLSSIGRITVDGRINSSTDHRIEAPAEITSGPDGAVWFTNLFGSSIGRISSDGHVTIYKGNEIDAATGITAGPDGALWFANSGYDPREDEFHGGSIGRITTSGHMRRYLDRPPDDPRASPQAIVTGPDHALWFTRTGSGHGSIGRITTDGEISSYSDPSTNTPRGIAVGNDGALWFANSGANSIGRITTDGDISSYHDPTIDTPTAVTSGPDRALWFTNSNSIGRITTNGQVSNYTHPSIDRPSAITAGPDGALWFTNNGGDSIGRISTRGTVSNYTYTHPTIDKAR